MIMPIGRWLVNVRPAFQLITPAQPSLFGAANAARVLQRSATGECEMTQVTGTGKYEQLLERCKNLSPIPTAVAHPCDSSSLSGAMEAAKLGLINPLLVGPAGKISEIASSMRIDIGEQQIVDAPHSHAAA